MANAARTIAALRSLQDASSVGSCSSLGSEPITCAVDAVLQSTS
jgi:hypothetical protein